VALWRPYAQQISNNAGVTSANKIAVGVNPKTSVPLPITAPTTFPVLSAQSSSTAGIILRYRDNTASPNVKAKPYGVVATVVFALPSSTVVTNPALLIYQGNQTKSPFTLSIGASSGTVVYMAARWITKKGLLGPWGPIISYVSAEA
jgi:hypothetical protein